MFPDVQLKADSPVDNTFYRILKLLKESSVNGLLSRFKSLVKADRIMHLLYLFILFAIPSVLLAQKCPRQFLNPRTRRMEVRNNNCK